MRKSPYEFGPAGDAASREGLARLNKEVASLKATKTALLELKRGLKYAAEKKFEKAEVAATAAAKLDPSLGYAWHLMGIARDKQSNWPGALEAYEKALALNPESADIANDLGRLAFKMEMWPQAEALFRLCLARKHAAPEASNNLAALLRRQMRYDEAIEILRTSLMANPKQPMLWVTLGTVVGDQGRPDEAATFYTEALRLSPNYAKALYNMSGIMFSRGQEEEAIAQTLHALTMAESAPDATMMRFATGTMSLGRGDLTQGWKYYAARLEPTFTEPVEFLSRRPRWTPDTDIAGAHLMLFGEQGLGDEILFANLLDDVIAALGPSGRLTLAVTDRLVSYFQRSFPDARVGSHLTIAHNGRAVRAAPFIKDWETIDYWAPIGELLQTFRGTVESFPERPNGFMRADPERVEYWRGVLAELPGVKAGLLWTSLVLDNNRSLYFSPFEEWEPVIRTPGVTFVNLQYGDQSKDLAFAKEKFGVDIFQPPGIDLRNDLDEVAALSAALDMVIGVSNASFNIAAAVGTPAWLIASHRSWPRLGSDRYLWYSQVRTFSAPKLYDWAGIMAQMAAALREHVSDGTRLVAAG